MHQIEQEIVTALVDEALAKGYSLSIDDGGDELALVRSADRKEILAAIGQAGDEWIHIHVPGSTRSRDGWVFLVYGNEPYYVINDYTVNPITKGVVKATEALVAKYEELATW